MTNIAEVLQDIELSDDHVKALDEFFEGHTQQIREQVTEELREEITEEVKSEVEITREDAERAFELFEADCEKAFELFEKDAEKAFELFESDAEKAFELGIEDVQKEYTENMTKALQDIYEDIEERAKSDVMESKEFKALEQVRKAIAPIVLTEDQKELLDEIEKVRAEKEALAEEKQVIERAKIIDTLMADFPEKYEEAVRKFIESAKTEDEIYERFNTMCEMIEIDPEDIQTVIDEEEDVDDEDDEDDVDDEEDVVNEDTNDDEDKEVFTESIVNVKNKESKTKEKIPGLSQEDEDLINLAFAQMAPK